MKHGAVVTASAAAAALTAHTAVNAALLRRPPARPAAVGARVSVLLPVRDEAHRVGPCLEALLAQEGVPDLEVLVLDDGSSDGTADVVRGVAGGRVRLLPGAELRSGWLGKPHACQQLADAASGEVLVFVDADVVLATHAVAACVALLDAGLDLVSPYPRQVAGTAAERLVQPLLQWSWLALLPLRLAERSSRGSLSAANGQLLAVRRTAYVRAGGHRAVRTEVLEDVALVRRVKATGGRGGVADGTRLATCRMYASWPELRDGYAKSLWAAGGTPVASAAQVGVLTALQVLPAVAAVLSRDPRTRRAGALGYAAAVAGRVLSAARTGGRTWPDPLAQPVSVGVLAYLTGLSWVRRRRGTATWKGRAL